MNQQSHQLARKVLPAAVFIAALAPACALKPPVQNSGAAVNDGIQVAVVGQRCTETVETELPGVNLVETTVEIQVRNATPSPLVVHRDAFQLRGPDGRAIPNSGWGAGEPLSVDAGSAQTFQLRFTSRGGLSCRKAMQLEPAAGVAQGAESIKLGAVTFVPSHV